MAAYIMLAAILVIVIGVFRNCGRINYEPTEGNSTGDTLDIALIYGPGSYYLYGDSISGINYMIGREFEKSSGIPVKFWPVTEPSSALEKLENGSFDIVASLPLDNKIKSRFPVSESIFLDRLVLVELADSSGNVPVTSSLDLNGKTVSVAAGSSGAYRMKNLAEEIGGSITVNEMPEVSDELLTLQVATKEIPLAIVNERIAKDLAKKYPDLNYDSSVSFTQFQVWVFSPTDSLLQSSFSRWFNDFSNSPDYRKIINSF